MIWDFVQYKPYLISKLGGEKARTGMRKRLAAYIPVHSTFISQVLKGELDFSLEQGEAINGFLEHTHEEGDYFLLLLIKDRAGSQSLKKRYQSKIAKIQDQRLNISQRLGTENEISIRDREKFYSNYNYGAIHVLCGIPQFGSIEKLSDTLRLPRNRIQEMIDFCLRIGVLIKEGDYFTPGNRHVHLDSGSELVLNHHKNWRQHAIQSLQFLVPEDIHYSACLSLSQKDAYKIKELLMDHLKSYVEIISHSPEEVPYVLNLDFYKF